MPPRWSSAHCWAEELVSQLLPDPERLKPSEATSLTWGPAHHLVWLPRGLTGPVPLSPGALLLTDISTVLVVETRATSLPVPGHLGHRVGCASLEHLELGPPRLAQHWGAVNRLFFTCPLTTGCPGSRSSLDCPGPSPPCEVPVSKQGFHFHFATYFYQMSVGS